jgi:2-oxoglutarate dehydrogenase E2 component (dihydrolipoamide succinyltransferase)
MQPKLKGPHMNIEIKVPSFGESVTEAIVVKIIKPSGTLVQKDEEIVELETDKVNATINAPAAGKITLSVNLEDRVKIGDTIGFVDSTHAVESTPSQTVATPTKPQPQLVAPSSKDIQIDRDTYLASLNAPQPTPAKPTASPESTPSMLLTSHSASKGERKKMSSLRKTIAKRLVEVKNQTAMLTTFNEVDMTQVMEIRKKEQEEFLKKYGVKLGFMSFFVKACVSALKATPEITAIIEGDDMVYFNSMDIGVAVSTDKGLMVPVLKNAQDMNFGAIEKAIGEYSKKAREGKLAIQDLQGGNFTITNGGVFGSLLSTPILNPPQSAILGMHTIQKRAVVVNDEIVIRPMMYLALSYDHRVVDGKEAVTFLVNVKQNLEDPSRLLLDF